MTYMPNYTKELQLDKVPIEQLKLLVKQTFETYIYFYTEYIRRQIKESIQNNLGV